MRKPGVASRASFEDMEEGMPVLSDPKQEEQDSQIQVCISPSSADTSCSRAHSQDDWSSTMLKSGVAPLASLEDLEEEVPMLPDPNSGEQKMEHYLSSASIYESASELNSQDDRDQHHLEVVDDNELTRDQGAEAERQESIRPSSNSGKDRFISTLNMLKELIEKIEVEMGRRLTPVRWRMSEVIRAMVSILSLLKIYTEDPSTAVDKDLIHEWKVGYMNVMWDEMSSSDKMRMRTVLFVVISQIQREIMTNWGLEEDLKPVAHVREIVQKLLVCVRTAGSDDEYILHLQRKVSNHTWRFNHLDESSKSYEALEALFEELVELHDVLLSSSIELMVVLCPSLEYYAQGWGSNPVLLSRGNSDVCFQTLTNVCESDVGQCHQQDCESLRHPPLNALGIKWLHLALSEMQLEQKEWADIIRGRPRSRNGGDSADMGTESIGSILKEALNTSSCLLELRTDAVEMYQDDGDETWSMFCIEYLDKEKFGDTKRISDINQLVSMNRLLLRLWWTVDKLIEDYVRASKSEEDAEPYGTSLTELDDIPYADDAVGVTECNAAVEVFLDKFLRQIRSTNDNSSLHHSDVVLMLKNLRYTALSMEKERMKSLADIKRENLPALKSRLIAAYGANSPGACSWRRRLMMPTDALLFRIEREALRKIVSSPECNVFENMDKVAAPNRSYRRSNLEDHILENAITSFSISEIPEPRADVIDEELSIDVTSEQNTCSPRTTQVSSAQRFAQQADNLSFSESTPSGPSGAVTSKPFKRAKPLTPTDQLLVTVGQRLQEVKKEDQFDLYGKHVAQKLRLLIPEQRIFAQKLMNDALFEAELGSLHRNASINTGFPLEYGPPSHSSDHSFQSQISVQQHQTNSNYRSTSEEQQSFFDAL